MVNNSLLPSIIIAIITLVAPMLLAAIWNFFHTKKLVDISKIVVASFYTVIVLISIRYGVWLIATFLMKLGARTEITWRAVLILGIFVFLLFEIVNFILLFLVKRIQKILPRHIQSIVLKNRWSRKYKLLFHMAFIVFTFYFILALLNSWLLSHPLTAGLIMACIVYAPTIYLFANCVQNRYKCISFITQSGEQYRNIDYNTCKDTTKTIVLYKRNKKGAIIKEISFPKSNLQKIEYVLNLEEE